MFHAIILTLLLGAGQMETGSLEKGLEGRWVLDDGHLGNGVVRDSTTYGNDLTPVASPSFGSAGVTLNGSTQYLEKNVAFRTTDQQGVVCGWTYATDFSNAPAVFGIANSGNDTDYFSFGYQTSGQLFHVTRIGGTTNRVESTVTIGTSEWHHICVTSNGSRFLLYLDGSSVAVSLITGTNDGQWIGDLAAAPNRLTVGRLSRSSPILEFSGTIFDVRYYSRELTPTEIGYLYAQGRRVVGFETGSLESGAVLSWEMNDQTLGSSTLMRDTSPSGYEATIVGTPTIGDDVTLNGSTQWIKRSEANWRSLDTLGCFTSWIYPTDLSANTVFWASGDEATGGGGAGHYLYGLLTTTGDIGVVKQETGDRNIVVSSTTTVTINAWWHVAICSDNSIYYIWINSAAQSLAASDGSNDGDWLDSVTARDYVLAGGWDSTGPVYFPGKLGPFKYYDRLVTTAEMEHAYAQGPRVVAFETGYSYKGLVASWPLTSNYKASATVMRDADISGYEVTLSGAPTIDSNGMTLDGTEYAERTVADFRSSDSSGTIACWFKATAANGFLFASSDEASTTRRLQLQLSSSGGIRVRQENADTADDIQANDTDFTDGNWHLAAVSSSGTAYSIYTDGTVESSLTVVTGSNSGDWFADTPNRDNITLGVLHTSAGYANHLTGTLAYCQVFDVALSADEHGYLYAYGQRP